MFFVTNASIAASAQKKLALLRTCNEHMITETGGVVASSSRFLWQQHMLLMSMMMLLLCHFMLLPSHLHSSAYAAEEEQATPLTVNVGAIVDLNTRIGTVAKQAMEMAVNDINANSSVLNGSKLVLLTKDSNSTAFQGSAVAVELLQQNTVAIAGPQSSTVAHFLALVASATQVPFVSFAVTDPALTDNRYPYFLRMPQSDTFQMQAVASVIDHYGWPQVVALYSDDEYGANGITALSDAIDNAGARILFKAAIAPGINKTEINNLLNFLSTLDARVFVIHVSEDIGFMLLYAANQMGLMATGYTWIVTELTIANLDTANLNSNALQSIEGVIGTRSRIPDSPRRQGFELEWDHYEEKQKDLSHLNVYGLYAYDSIWLIATAVDSFLKQGGSFEFQNPNREPNDAGGSFELSQLKVFTKGPLLRQIILQTKFNGTSGPIQLNMKDDLVVPAYEIVNMVRNKLNVVGYWTKESGLSTSFPGNQDVHLVPQLAAHSPNQLFDVTWPGGSKKAPQGWVLSKSGRPLKIAVPRRVDYPQVLSISGTGNNVSFQGFCIDVFKAALQELPYNVPYEFIPFGDGKSNPNYTEMIKLLADKAFDAVIGDVTITTPRLQLVDFTQPYKQSGLVVVIPVNDGGSNPLNFLRPFTSAMWGVTGAFFILFAIVIWILEHKKNSDFRGPPQQQVSTTLWFSFSTLYFSQRENTKSVLGRAVLIIWLFVLLIITSAYTANLTSILTVQQLAAPIQGISSLQASNDPIGFQAGSFVKNYLLSLNIAPERLRSFSTVESFTRALKLGPSRGGVAAMVDERPYVEVLLSSQCGLSIAGQEFTKAGWGFAFQRDSPLAVDVSAALLNVSESGKLQKLNDFWLTKPACGSDNQSQADQISLSSLWGLFVISGATSVICVILYFIHMFWKFHHMDDSSQYTTFFHYLFGFTHKETAPVQCNSHKLPDCC